MRRRLLIYAVGLLLSLMATGAAAEVVVVVADRSPVDTLSEAELTDIFLGRLERLPGGHPVTPVDQAERTSAYREFYADYLGRSASQIKAHWSKLIFTGRGQPPRSFRDGEAVAEFVSANPDAIGYVDRSLVGDGLRVVSIE
ncbi:phosphate ABC transporter substrate-binding protein [Arhodomonas sp. SL1]|uniref:phosphate ABC transporter substrate-binding protein n=1 Tax=Arhodomonas sp. SL1 TaxID=3425691 RepID=UPI003F884449